MHGRWRFDVAVAAVGLRPHQLLRFDSLPAFGVPGHFPPRMRGLLNAHSADSDVRGHPGGESHRTKLDSLCASKGITSIPAELHENIARMP